ncbi:peptidase M19 renal dipeptidase [Brucella abortus]|nr:peptidase M19 renal dipeptidase [Brucella abortus]
MATEQTIKVFDGHNDVLLRLWSSNQPEPENRFLEGESSGHIDLPRARKGGLGGGLCAVYVPHLRTILMRTATCRRQASRMP